MVYLGDVQSGVVSGRTEWCCEWTYRVGLRGDVQSGVVSGRTVWCIVGSYRVTSSSTTSHINSKKR